MGSIDEDQELLDAVLIAEILADRGKFLDIDSTIVKTRVDEHGALALHV
jgi:hypothetical protein